MHTRSSTLNTIRSVHPSLRRRAAFQWPYAFIATCALGALCGLYACSGSPPDTAGLRIVFEDEDAGRLGLCSLEGGRPNYITPDTLVASGPVTDSLRTTVYFIARPRSRPEALASIFAVNVSGTDLRQVAEVPLSVLDLQITPDGTKLVFLGRYPDQENTRAYEMMVGESGFQAVTPDHKTVHDPAMAPGGLNFVWHDGSHGDTLFVSSLQSFLTLPIYTFPYTQVSLRWPDGRAFAAVCGPNRHGLCYNLLQDTTGAEGRRETVLIEEQVGVQISDPVFHLDDQLILYVETQTADPGTSQLCLIDRNSLKITRIPLDCRRPRHPVWVR